MAPPVCPSCGQAGSAHFESPPSLFPLLLTHHLRSTGRHLEAASKGPQPPRAHEIHSQLPFDTPSLTLVWCLSRAASTHLRLSMAFPAVGEGGGGRGGVGGERRAPAAPLAVDRAPARRVSPARRFSRKTGRSGLWVLICAPCVRKRPRDTARACGIVRGVPHGRTRAKVSVPHVFRGRPWSPACALRVILRHGFTYGKKMWCVRVPCGT